MSTKNLNKSPTLETVTKIIDTLKHLPNFQKNKSDELIVQMLAEEFPDVDLNEEAKKYLFWVIDQQQDGNSRRKWNYRSRFRLWLKNASRNPDDISRKWQK